MASRAEVRGVGESLTLGVAYVESVRVADRVTIVGYRAPGKGDWAVIEKGGFRVKVSPINVNAIYIVDLARGVVGDFQRAALAINRLH